VKRDDAARARDDARESYDLSGRRFGIVAARVHRALVDRLLDGAVTQLRSHGVQPDDIRVLSVPGAWEIPLALDDLAAAGHCEALVALGAVVRGETPHFEDVCGEASRGCMDVSLRRRIPVGFGILTTDDEAQARARAGGDAGNKGQEAAAAAAEMLRLQDQLRDGVGGGTA